jgi:hypothetical protein
MDQLIATELAFESPEITNLIERESAEIISFRLQPGYRAILNIKDPKFQNKEPVGRVEQ